MRLMLNGLLGLGLLLLTACVNVYEWNQKLTVVVQTPGGEVSGSSVTRIQKTETNGFLFPIEARGVQSSLTGEAVVVEVSPDQYLFVLLDGTDVLAQRAFPQFTYTDDTFGEWARTIQEHREPGEVPLEHYPMMVTFLNSTDPESVRLVSPDDLAEFFGAGVTLKGMILEITEEPMTVGVLEGILNWWLTLRSGPYNEMTPLQLPNDSPRGWQNLGARSFWSLERLQLFNEVSE